MKELIARMAGGLFFLSGLLLGMSILAHDKALNKQAPATPAEWVPYVWMWLAIICAVCFVIQHFLFKSVEKKKAIEKAKRETEARRVMVENARQLLRWGK